MICSVMICSYKRPDGLIRAIRSLQATAADPDSFEILVRFSEVDAESLRRWSKIESLGGVRVFVGPQLNGYASLGDYFMELLPCATGKRISIFDDDMTLEGEKWDLKLSESPEKTVVVCERYRLGPNLYPPGSCDGPCIGWFLPRLGWQDFTPIIGNPPDYWMRKNLVDKHGWPIHHLKGITLNHQWMRPKDGDR